LAANNLRDRPTDAESGKKTLAVRLGDSGARTFYSTLALAPFVITLALAFFSLWFLLGLLALPLMIRSVQIVRDDGRGPALIPVLKDTAMGMLIWAITTTVATILS